MQEHRQTTPTQAKDTPPRTGTAASTRQGDQARNTVRRTRGQPRKEPPMLSTPNSPTGETLPRGPGNHRAPSQLCPAQTPRNDGDASDAASPLCWQVRSVLLQPQGWEHSRWTRPRGQRGNTALPGSTCLRPLQHREERGSPPSPRPPGWLQSPLTGPARPTALRQLHCAVNAVVPRNVHNTDTEHNPVHAITKGKEQKTVATLLSILHATRFVGQGLALGGRGGRRGPARPPSHLCDYSS